MNLDLLPQVLTSGVVLGSAYALVAVGFVVIYRTTGAINFAQGELLLLGAYITMEFRSSGFPDAVAVAAAVALTAAVGALLYLGVALPLSGRPPLAVAIATLGVSLAARSVLAIVWTSQALPLDLSWSDGVIDLPLDVTITRYGLATLVSAGVVGVALWAFFGRTNVGIAMRATAEQPILAGLSAVPTRRLSATAWAVAGALAAIAGVGLSSSTSVTPGLADAGLRAFPAAVLGGMDSVAGAFVGGAILGIAETVVVVYVDPSLKDVVSFILFLAILLVRPSGLFGQREIVRV